MQPMQDSQDTQTWQTPHRQQTKRKMGTVRGIPPMAEEVQQARHWALADVMAFKKTTQAYPTTSGDNSIDREENTDVALSNGTDQSDSTDLSNSEQYLPIVTPRTADDLL
ncbi:hypothetical protein NDU88_003938 [Pleurodeles waltl]|uniref:Uncharacterized protein n=1 Tax=Pleurodeles waltl TaxID=8319 RepID=A0AAV7QH11_PLEWA|nr:hypothetical protein NDU88_003938 [Pleurodeles waltl]